MTLNHSRRLFCAGAIAFTLLAPTAVRAELTDADRKAGLAQLERTRQGVLDATRSLSPAQWTFQSAPDRWSVAQVLEHIVLTEQALFQEITTEVMRAPAGKPGRDLPAIDKQVVTIIADRSQKARAPQELVPSGRWSPAESMERFQQTRQKTIDYLRQTQGLRDHATDSPIGQPLDAYQWLLFISAHSERHTRQMLEVKADPAFPRK